MFAVYFTFLLLISCSYTFQDCGSKDEVIESVSVSDCAEESVCVAKRSANITIDIIFSGVDAKNVTTEVSGILAGEFTVPWLSVNSCTDYGITCPITKDQRNNYKGTVWVSNLYPTIRVDVKWELKDENKDNFVCVLIPLQIQ